MVEGEHQKHNVLCILNAATYPHQTSYLLILAVFPFDFATISQASAICSLLDLQRLSYQRCRV